MADNEIGEMHQRAGQAMTAVIQAAGQIAGVLFEARIALLRRAAEQGQERVREIREQARAWHQADAAIWRPVARPQWWKDAGAEDIARAWRAASAWDQVDPGAQAAREVVAARLAERGVMIDPSQSERVADVEWLSNALDLAAAERAVEEQQEAGVDASRDGERQGEVGEAVEPVEAAESEAQRQARLVAEDEGRRERMAAHVKAVWPGSLADRVIECEAAGALAYRLDELERDGHDVEALLRGVPDFASRAERPAAYACRIVVDTAAERAATEEKPATSARQSGWDVGADVVAGASEEQVRAALLDWYEKDLQAARAAQQSGGHRERGGYAPADRIIRAQNALRSFRDGPVKHWMTHQSREVQDAVVARLREQAGDEASVGGAKRASERDARSEADEWSHTRTDPPGVAQAHVADAVADANTVGAQADSHEVRAAELAAQGYPTSTAEAVSVEAEAVRKSPGGRTDRATGRTATKRARPSTQRGRKDPRGR